jgi:hypothetical protein
MAASVVFDTPLVELGRGASGIVYAGTLGAVPVAVKKIRLSGPLPERVKVLADLATMQVWAVSSKSPFVHV